MARMIPPIVTPSCCSPGERDIFLKLQDESLAEKWIVLHSLDISSHLRQVCGEADFVIIVPGMGVLCLEVKACHSLRRNDGLWYYGNSKVGDSRGPFKQSSEAMHSLRLHVVRSDSDLQRVPFWSAVAFPFVDFSADSDEWHRWQVIDRKLYQRQSFATLVKSVLRNARTFLNKQPSARWFRDTDKLPTEKQSAAIARILRPSFEFREKPVQRRKRSENELLRFTEEQFIALDAMASNSRVLFSGPAGTGKTVLALEAARRASITGKRVLLVCFNRLLGRWLSRHQFSETELITALNLHQYMLGVSGVRPPGIPDDRFWSHQLPELAVAKLLSENRTTCRFDTLIVDEVQDILRPQYLDLLDLVLEGGLVSGNWLMFGDFERQMLYGQSVGEIEELIQSRLRGFSRFSLRVNCRNTPRIAAMCHLLGKLSPDYTRILRPDDRIEPELVYYATPSQQRRQIVKILERLQMESFNSDDIVLLSAKAGPRCAAANIEKEPWHSLLGPLENYKDEQIPFTTIHSYKGLESPVVIVTDVEHLDGDLFSSLFYVAATRPLERLFVFVHETAKSDIVKALTENVGDNPEKING